MIPLRPYRILLAAILCCLLASPALALDPWEPLPECIFGMPYMGRAVEKDQQGMITAVLREIFEPENIRLRHRHIPYERAVEETRQGKIQCTLDVGVRQNGMLHPKHPIFFYDLAVARLRTTEWKGLASLKGARVAFRYGFGLDSFVPVKFTPQLLFDLASAYHQLEQGLVTYALGDIRLLRRAMFDSKLGDQFFAIDPIKSYKVYPIFASTKEGRHLRDIYDRRMAALIASGDLAHILEANGLEQKEIQRILAAQ